MNAQKRRNIEIYAASAWLAKVSLHELASQVKNYSTRRLCHRVYTKLNAMENSLELEDRKETK